MSRRSSEAWTACWLCGFSGWWFAGPQLSGYMSYTELLLVCLTVDRCGIDLACWTTSRRVAEPAHPVVGLTNEESRARIADRARREVLCGSAAERLIGWIW